MAEVLDPFILVSKEEVDEQTKDLFSKEAREWDFVFEIEKQMY